MANAELGAAAGPAPAEVPIRQAATVMLVRDGATGVEVCMLQRRLQSAFVAGMHVFPGGALDHEDADPRWNDRVQGLDDGLASERLGIDRGGLAYWIAAVRETIEECSLFPALRADGSMLRIDGPGEAVRFEQHRVALDAGETDLLAICEAEDLRLDVGGMHYFARWITPKGVSRRYDTRFFVAAAPEGQEAVHDGRETIASVWIRPIDALAGLAAEDLSMLPPTVACLRSLLPYASVHEILAAAEASKLSADPPRHGFGPE